jgi:peptide/nickel transport system substrate-binding protein
VKLPPHARFDPDRERDAATGSEYEKMLTRRAVLVRAGGVGLSSFTLAGLLAACGSGNQSSDSSSGTKASGDAPGRGGTLTLAVDGTNGIADPAFYTTLGDWMAVDCICRGLTFIDFTDTKPKPDLAERWEISDDGRTYQFFLREGVKFHDGTTLSAKDVLRSLERQLNPKDPTLPPGGSGPFFTAVGDNVKSIKDVDDMTVEFKLKVPDALLLAKLSDIGGRIISSTALEKYKKDIGTHLTGTGPFRLVDARQGEAMTMEAFEDYKDGRPPIDRLVLQQAQDPSTIVGSIIGGQISATQFTPYSALEELSSNDKVTVYDTKRGFDAFVMMDVRRPVMKDIRVRKAINKAIDRQAIIQQAFFGVADEPKGYAIPTTQLAHDPGLADISTQDMDEAKRLVEEAGAKGKRVWVLAASDSWHPRAAQIIVQNLKEAGLDAKSELVDPGTYAGRVFNPDDPKHDMMVWERNQFVPDPDNMVGAMANPNQVYGAVVSGQVTLPNQQHYVADLIKARNLPDGDERKQAYTDIQREWADKEMVLAMLAYSANPVVSGSNVKGMNTEALSNHRCFMEGASV